VSAAVAAALQDGRPTVIDVPLDPDAITSFRKDSFPHRAATQTK
jgi:thiamine pyrophosphate-dependent acetolactate synthase large subunit-like protein